MSYWQYWNLNAAPFKNNGRYHFFRGQAADEALARIEFVCGQKRGVATLVGPAGVGKSTLLNFVAQQPPKMSASARPTVACLSMAGLSAGELPLNVSMRLSGRRIHGVHQAWQALTDCLAATERCESQVLLLIDDVECAGADAEIDLIRLVRLTSGMQVSIVLAIESHLASAVSRWLVERSYLQVDLAAWDTAQTREFLRFSLQASGGTDPVFSDAAVVKIQELTRGIPRRIVQMADLALVAGAVAGVSRIDASIIVQVAQELPADQPAAA